METSRSKGLLPGKSCHPLDCRNLEKAASGFEVYLFDRVSEKAIVPVSLPHPIDDYERVVGHFCIV